MPRTLRFERALFIWLALSGACLANGVMLNDVSPRALSRGGTNLGHADNGGILFDNPAAMMNIDGKQLCEVSVILPICTMHYTDPQNDVWSTGATPLPQASIIRKTDDGLFAFGLGFYVPAGFEETYDMQGPPEWPGNRRFESFGALAKILPGVACRLTENLSVGGTLGVGYSYAQFEAPYILQGPSLPGVPTEINTHGAGACLLWSVGAQYELSESTMIGAAYQGPSRFTLDGNTHIEVPGLGSSSYDSSIDITWPQSVGVGVRHAFCPHRVVSVDVIYYDWASAFDDFSVQLRGPSNPIYPQVVDENVPLNWHGSVTAKFGYEHMLRRGTMLRLGYAYNNNPIPASTITPLIQATFEHAVSVGLGWQLGDFDIDLGYMHMFAPDVHVGPTNDFIGNQYANSTHQAAVDAIFIGLIHRR